MSGLKEFKVIETALVGFESSSHGFNLSPDIDKGFRVSGSRNPGIFEISEHDSEFWTREEIHALLEMPGVPPPMFLTQGIPFSHGLGFRLGEVKDIPDLFFKEKDLFDRGSFIDLYHFRDEQVFFFGPSVHMFEQAPFHLPEFFSVQGPAFSFERFSKLDEGIFEVIPEPLHDVEVVVLEGSFGPDFTDDFGEGGPEVEDNAVGLDAPAIKFSKKSFGNTPAIEPRDGFDIEDSALESISGDLFISTSPFGHVFINREGSRELELAEDPWEVILGGKTFLPSIQGGFGPRGIETS